MKFKNFIIGILFVFFCQTTLLIAQTPSKYGTDSISCMKNLSLYREFYKQGLYKDALTGWQYVFTNCPASSKNIYIHGANMYISRINELTNGTAQRKHCIDTLLLIYDRRAQYFGEADDMTGRKGLALWLYDKAQTQQAYNYLTTSVKKQQQSADEFMLQAWVETSVALLDKQALTIEQTVENYTQATTWLEKKQQSTTDANAKQKIQQATSATEKAFLGSKQLDCITLNNLYSKNFNQLEFSVTSKNNDVTLLKKYIQTFTQARCTTDRLYYTMIEKLNEQEPTSENAQLAADIYGRQNDIPNTLKYYNKAAQLQTDAYKKAVIYYNAAVYLSNKQQKNEARSYAQQAIQTYSSWGKPYILIGLLYASSASECKKAQSLDEKAVYWAAVDQFEKAIKNDAASATEAQTLISQYEALYPSREDAFFYGYTQGQQYVLSCWINETTTVRTQAKK